jgi:hypothetical protein
LEATAVFGRDYSCARIPRMQLKEEVRPRKQRVFAVGGQICLALFLRRVILFHVVGQAR